MNVLARLKQCTAVVLDIDGVLTNGQVLLLPDGTQARSMNIKDGFALQLAVSLGKRIVVISGGSSTESQQRLHRLGIQEVFLNVKNKLECLTALGLKPADVAYMGDDLPDLDLLAAAGFACCPADAAADVLSMCTYISPCKGGEGAVRDLLEKWLRLQNCWPTHTTLQSR